MKSKAYTLAGWSDFIRRHGVWPWNLREQPITARQFIRWLARNGELVRRGDNMATRFGITYCSQPGGIYVAGTRVDNIQVGDDFRPSRLTRLLWEYCRARSEAIKEADRRDATARSAWEQERRVRELQEQLQRLSPAWKCYQQQPRASVQAMQAAADDLALLMTGETIYEQQHARR